MKMIAPFCVGDVTALNGTEEIEGHPAMLVCEVRMEVRLLYVRHFPMYLTLKTTDENSMQIFGQFSVLLQAIMRERGKREI